MEAISVIFVKVSWVMSAAKLVAKHSQIQRRNPHRADKGERQQKNATGRNRAVVQKRDRWSAITSIEWDNRPVTDSGRVDGARAAKQRMVAGGSTPEGHTLPNKRGARILLRIWQAACLRA